MLDNVGEALTHAMDNGVKNLVIQPTHLLDVIAAETAPYDDENTAICFMGHGTEGNLRWMMCLRRCRKVSIPE